MHRPIVIAGSHDEFIGWCDFHRTNPLAARFVDSGASLVAALRDHADVRLWGNFRANPAYRTLTRCGPTPRATPNQS